MAFCKKKTLNIVFAFALLAALFLPQMALAVAPTGGKSNPTLTIHKYEQEPGAEKGEDGTGMPGQNVKSGAPVPDVTYEITQTHSFDPGENEWKEVTAAPTITKKTNADGEAVFSGLHLGRYEVKEVSGPAHILLNKEPFYVDIPMTNKEGTTLNYDVHVYPKNETIRKDVEFKKVGEDGKTLAGVSFDLYQANGEKAKDKDGNAITGLKTGNNGLIKVSGLAAGKYYFQETAVPAKYALNNTNIEFEVKKTGDKREDITVAWTPVTGFVNEGVVTNYFSPEIEKDANGQDKLQIDRNTEFPYNLTIKTPGDIKEYSKFIVTDQLDDRLEYITDSWTVTGAEKSDFEFTKDGQLLTWKVTNFAALSGDKDIKITFKAKIHPDAELGDTESGIPNTANLEFDNSRGWTGNTTPSSPPEVTPNNGGLTVTKVDASTGAKLSGAEFRLTDADGNAINVKGTTVKVNKQKVDNLEKLISDNDGKIEITGLTPGTFYLEETKAPTYTENGETKSYRLLVQPIEVTIEHGKPAEVEVKNSKSGWLLPTTGGIGTVLFTSGGLSLMMAAMVMYARRRKSESGAA